MKHLLLSAALLLSLTLGGQTAPEPFSLTLVPTDEQKSSGQPYILSPELPDGNYKVTVRLGDKKHSGSTTVRCESRRLFLNRVPTRKGEFKELSFTVNKRNRCITPGDSVRTKSKETHRPVWDDRLSIEINGPAPAIDKITIEQAPESVTTVFLFGNSTVVDQANDPWCSWGQIVPHFFDESVCVANYAESGESAHTSITAKRLKKALTHMKPGDYVFIEFGHNDQKQKNPGSGAYYSFATALKTFIDEIRLKGATPVLVTPTCRRRFNAEGEIQNTHGDYPDAMRWVAEREGVTLIELNPMTKMLYEALGTETSKKAFVHYPNGTFPGQNRALADDTHFNPYGATQVAKCVLTGIREQLPALGSHIVGLGDYDPAHPDNPELFAWDLSPYIDMSKPDGN